MLTISFEWDNKKANENLKKQVTLRLNVDVVEYIKKQSEETGVPYQNLINLYLQDCAHSQKKLKLNWVLDRYQITGRCSGVRYNWSSGLIRNAL